MSPPAEVVVDVDAVLFDSDGVLVDSHAQVDVAWRALAGEFGLDFDLLAEQLVGVPARQTLARHLSGDRLDAAVDRLEQLEVATAGSTVAIAGARALLANLPTGRWGIVTSASRRLGEARWRGAGLVVPDHTVTADDVACGKPAPDPYLAAAALLGADPSRCLVFEDSAAGGDAATAAEIPVVAVGCQPWRVRPIARIRDLGELRVEPGRMGALHVTLAPRALCDDR